MAFTPVTLNNKTEALTKHRNMISIIFRFVCFICISGGIGLASKEGDGVYLVFGGIILAGFYVLKTLGTLVLDYLFVKSFYEGMLFVIDKHSELWNGSPSLRRARYRSYGAFKAMFIIQRANRVNVGLIGVLCLAGFQLVFPTLMLFWCLYIRYFTLAKQSSLEEEFLGKLGNHPAIHALFEIEDVDAFNSVLLQILTMGSESQQVG